MKKLASFWNKYWMYIIAFCIPWFLVLVKGIIFNGWPFGENTLLSGDTSAQLVPFAYGIWDKVHLGESMNYTWNLGGGCDFNAVLGYYLSPFTLLILIFPRSCVVNMVQFVMILKWACLAVAMVHFFYCTKYNTLTVYKKAVSLFLGMAFVLSNSQISFVRYFQYTDVFICFPILLLLVERMVEKKKWMLYCLILAFIIFSNMYVAFQVCIFLTFWFFFQLGPEVKDKLKCFGLFAGSSILSAVITGASIIGVIIGSSDRMKNTGVNERLSFAKNWGISIDKFFSQFFVFSTIGDPQDTTPNIYFSIVCLILVCLFVVIKINVRQKIHLLSCVFVLLLSFFNGYLNIFWHLFTPPNGVYNRFSNLFVFSMLLLVLFVLEHLEDLKVRHVLIVGMIMTACGIHSFFSITHYKSIIIYLGTALLFVLYILLLSYYCRKSISYKGMLATIIVLGIIELVSNASLQLLGEYNSSLYSSRNDKLSEIIDVIEESDMSYGERISFGVSGFHDFGLNASKPCISGFSSSINNNMLLLMDKLGMGVGGDVTYTLMGASPLIDLMFNVKYDFTESTCKADGKEYYEIHSKDYKLYKNNELAGLGYMVNSEVENWDIFSGNSFEIQNSFAELSTGIQEKPFNIINPNVKCTDVNGNSIIRDEEYTKKNAYVYTYTGEYADERDSVQMEFVADEDMELYLDARNSFGGVFTFFVDDEVVGVSKSKINEATYYLGNIKKSQKVVIVAVVDKDFPNDAEYSVFLRFAKFDKDAYSKVYDVLSKNVYDIEEMNDEYIKGTIEADEDGIMMTSIQSDSGFDVYVDGKGTEYKTIGGALMGVPVSKGTHVVEFKYTKARTPISVKLISLCGMVLYLILCFISKSKGKRSGIDKLDVSSNVLGEHRTSKIKVIIKDKGFYILAFLIPWVIALTHSLFNDTWVTGNGNIAVGDLQAQIIPLAYELWDKIHLHQSINFTWHVVDGMSFSAMIGYLISPFTLVMLLLPRDTIPNFIQFSMLAKWSLCSLSMVYFFYNTRFNKLTTNKKLVSLFLGLAYALGNGIMSYIGFIQFMDVMICFPILVLLVEKMVSEDNTPWKLYYIILVWCMVSNAYPTFQICAFLAMWFILQICGDETNKLKKFLVFSLSSVAAAITNLWVVIWGLNTADERMTAVGETARAAFVSKPLISAWEFIKQFFFLEPITSVRSYCPNIYMTVTAAFLLLLFPVVKIERKRKICILLMLLFIMASFFVGHLNLLWHLMNIPNGVYNRFMFLFVFISLLIVLLVLGSLENLSYKVLVPCGMVAICLYAYTMASMTSFGNVLEYIATLLVVCFIIVISVLYIRKSFDNKQFVCVLAFLGIAEIIISSYNAFSYYDGALCYGENGLVNQACELLEKAELEKGERIVSLTPSPNVGMITNQNSDCGFLSAISSDNKALHENLGMSSNSNVEFGSRGASPICNLIFNLRYIHGESEMVCSDSDLYANDQYLQLYKTKRLAGLGYMVKDTVLEWDSKDKNCFQYQNDFIKKTVGGDDVFRAADGTVGFYDLEDNEIKPQEDMLKYGLYQYSLENLNHDSTDTRRLDFVAGRDMDLYMFFHSEQNLTNYIYIDGEQKHIDARQFKQSTYHIGNVKKGQTISVFSAPSAKTVYGNNYIISYLFADFNEDAYAASYEKLNKNTYNIETETADYIKGTIHADETGIMMTSIPKNYDVFVDGKLTEAKIVAGTFIGVPIEAGDHEVEFRYYTKSQKNGIAFACICLAVYLAICIFDKRKQCKVNDNN